MAYSNGSVTVTSTATLICTTPASLGNVLLANGSGAVVYLGGPGVTSSGANMGVPVAASTTVTVPISGAGDALYGIVASTSTTVTYLVPGATAVG